MDKLRIFMICVFLIVVLFIYNGYQAATGKVGPISQLMDNVGLKKLGSELERPKIVLKDFQGDLEKLRAQTSQSEEERESLIKRREMSIQELVKVNEQLKAELEKYLNQTYSEREAFLAQYPELVEIGNYLATGPRNTDGTATRRMEVQLRIMLGDIIRQLVNDPARLVNTYQDLRQAAGGESPLLAKLCPDSSLEQCFSQNPMEVKNLFSEAIVALMIQPKKDFQAMKESLQVLGREYNSLLENYSASESQLKEKYGALDTRFQDMVKEIAVGKKIDVVSLTGFYKKFSDEKKVILDNLQLNLERLQTMQKATSQQMESLFTRLKSPQGQASADDQSRFNGYVQLQATQSQLLSELEGGEQELSALAVQIWDAHKNFAGVLVEASRSYERLSAPANSQPSTANAGKNRVGRSPSSSPTTPGISPKGPSPSSARPATGSAQEGSSRAQSSNDQMQRARDHARDQGFYNR